MDKAMVQQLRREDADQGHVVHFAQVRLLLSLAHQPGNSAGFEEATLPQGPFREQLLDIVGRASIEETAVDGSAIWLFGPSPDVRWYQPSPQLLEQPFLRQSAQFQVGWQVVAEFHNSMVEEGKAPLYRVGHGHAVPLGGEKILRQKDGHLKILGLGQV
jgi:hypothetical protein